MSLNTRKLILAPIASLLLVSLADRDLLSTLDNEGKENSIVKVQIPLARPDSALIRQQQKVDESVAKPDQKLIQQQQQTTVQQEGVVPVPTKSSDPPDGSKP